MKISVIGAGYVGLTMACLANFGHEVVLIDVIKEKVDLINKGISPIYEPNLEDVIKNNLETNRLKATTNYDAISDTDIIFICVGTPSREDG